MQTRQHMISAIEANIIHSINKTSIELREYFSQILKKAHVTITLNEWLLLFHLLKTGGKNQKWYGEIIFHDKTATMRMIDRLERKKLVKRIQDQADRRQNLLYITKKGSDILDKLFPLLVDQLENISANIYLKDLETTKATLQKISKNIGME